MIMKKILTILLSFAMLYEAAAAVCAAGGGAVGHIYSTDIRACINGVWVDSYNIGGKTVVIVEDITNQFSYSDALRVLEIYDLSPDALVAGSALSLGTTGTVVGNIYETDIKTYFRGKELTAYSLDGKMAVVLEELGDDNTFSDIGGKFIWNPRTRTIVLESVYRYPYSMRRMMEDRHYDIVLTYSDGVLEAAPASAPLYGGFILCEWEIPGNSMIPVVYKNEIIGYRCSFLQKTFEQDENGQYSLGERQTPVDYFYTDKVEDMIFEAGAVQITAEDWLNYFKLHTLSNVKDSFETDEYIFLYMFSSAVMSGSDRLIKLSKADGTKTEYQNLIDRSHSVRFENVSIDREREKVYVTYGGDYVIDLRTDEVKPYTKLETDMGTGMADGAPSAYYATCAKEAQQKYTLVSEGEELTVDGFFCLEYYYSDMLPLKETLDFLNVSYSFENHVLTLDTSNAKASLDIVSTGEKVDFMGESPAEYLYIDHVISNGNETEITYSYISGHFENTYTGKKPAKPYVVNGKVYVNAAFFVDLISG